MNRLIFYIFATLAVFSIRPAYSQTIFDEIKKAVEQDPSAADAIALYPEDIQEAIFIASQHPQTMVRIATEQQNTSRDFRNLIRSLSPKQQEAIYDLVRFPDLIAEIIQGGKKSKSQLETIAKKYPKELHASVLEFGENNYELLVQIEDLYQKAQQQFQTMLQPLPNEARNAYRKLVAFPEVLELLQQNSDFTRLLGTAYHTDPKKVKERAKSYAEKNKEENDKALAEFNEEINQDPEAQKELAQSAQDFSRANGYDPNVYALPSSTSQTQTALTTETTTETTTTEQTSDESSSSDSGAAFGAGFSMGFLLGAIPYWFGSSSYWYGGWRRYPAWYHTGWYYRGGRVVVRHWPSHRYAHWYHHGNHRRYDRLNKHYDRVRERNPNVNRGWRQEAQRTGAGFRGDRGPATRDVGQMKRAQQPSRTTRAPQRRAATSPQRRATPQRQVTPQRQAAPQRAQARAPATPARSPQVARSTPNRSQQIHRANNHHRSNWGGRRSGGGPRGGGGGRRR